MNELVFGSSEAEELRAQLLKERRKRVDAEQRVRALEAEIRTVKPGFHIPEIVVSDSARIPKVREGHGNVFRIFLCICAFLRIGADIFNWNV